MLRSRVIPCLDVSAGRVVKGVNFVNLRDCGDPVSAARRYADQGADEICWLNITAGAESWRALLAQVEQAAIAIDVPLLVGGGITKPGHVRDLLAAGADKVSVNTAALDEPGLVRALAAAHGNQCIVVAIDAKQHRAGWYAHANGGTRPTSIDAVAWAIEATRLGAGELLVTSIDRDGTGAGYALDLLAAVLASVDVPVIASGGAAHAEHLADAFEVGCSAALAATIFHDATHSIEEVKNTCRARGIPMR